MMKGATKAETARLRGEFESDLTAEFLRASPEFNRFSVIRAWAKRGPSRATLYRWSDGWVGDRTSKPISSDGPAELPVEPAREKSADAGTAIAMSAEPARLRIDLDADISLAIGTIKRVLEYAQPEGKIRNARLSLHASSALMKALSDMSRIQEGLRDMHEVDRFMRAIVAEIEMESPELARRVITRLQTLGAAFA